MRLSRKEEALKMPPDGGGCKCGAVGRLQCAFRAQAGNSPLQGQTKAYVKEQTGLNVTHLNIAQVKRKSGIIERENYNLPKSADAKQSQCTKEKEEAILEALKHFHIIYLSSKS